MASAVTIPRRLPLLLVIDHVLLPGSSMRIPVNNVRNVNMIKSQLLSRNTLSSTVIGVIPVSSSDQDVYHPIGTAAVVVQVTGMSWPQPSYTLLVTGLCRFKLQKILQESPFLVALVNQLDHIPSSELDNESDNDLKKLVDNFREQAIKLVEMLDVSIPVVAKLKAMLNSLPVEHLPDVCTSVVKASYSEKIKILDSVDLRERFENTLPLILRQIEGLKLLKNSRKENIEIIEKCDPDKRSTRRDRTSIKLTSDFEDESGGDDITELEGKLRMAKLPLSVQKLVRKELKRLKEMPPQMPDHALIRNYLELVSDLPWNEVTQDSLDITKARTDLDADHYGLESLKKRLVEYLAVRKLRKSLKGPILCFVGPPGVGKTSVGRSIAASMGRKFHRISLGGISDQADIRGHRRTYIGAMPGRIIHGLKMCGTKNPVFLLDEIDKLSKSMQGDPAAALLEVLDPEQNNSFTDHFLNIPFDLSQVLFIATANNMSTIPPALLDRMETIQIPGYTQEEKVIIATRHLLPKQFRDHGLAADQVIIPDDSLELIVSSYTKEAGVRAMERHIAALCRSVAVRVAESNTSPLYPSQKAITAGDGNSVPTAGDGQPKDQKLPIILDKNAVTDILGPPEFYHDMVERLSQPGVAIGLAWTIHGGTIMYVEATKMPGEGKITLTGQLGEVIKESATLAINWLRSHSSELRLHDAAHLVKHTDLHVHFPEGSVGKDGPSAGITIVTVLVSLFSGYCVRSDTAMTGEITLRGLVLPVGGVKEKVLAAHRAGISRVLLPHRNHKDLRDLPENVKTNVEVILVSNVHDVLANAFYESFPCTDQPSFSSKL